MKYNLEKMAKTQQIHSASPVINMIHTEEGERRLHISPSSDQHSKRQDIHQSTRQAQPRQQPKPMQLQREERHQSYYQESEKPVAQEQEGGQQSAEEEDGA